MNQRCTICHAPKAGIMVALTLAGATRDLPYCNDCFARFLRIETREGRAADSFEARVIELEAK